MAAENAEFGSQKLPTTAPFGMLSFFAHQFPVNGRGTHCFPIEYSEVSAKLAFFCYSYTAIQLAGRSALALWGLGLALMPIDSAAPAYQLSDLKPADRLAVLRRTPFAFLDLELCGLLRKPLGFDTTYSYSRTEHLPVSSTIGALLTDAV
jgi:hypothetical protein